MKKVMVGAIAVLFLLVGFGYASAQQNNLNTNMAGALTSLSLKVTFESELAPTTTLSEGQSWITATPLIGRRLSADQQKLLGFTYQDDPILYMWVDGNGNLSQVNITWLDPNPNSPNYQTKIWTISCTGGNQMAPIPGLGPGGAAGIEDGTIATKPQANSRTVTRTDSVQGVLPCFICPDGFIYTLVDGTTPTLSNTTCNGGESYSSGYLTFKGTFYHNLTLNTITSASITGTVAGGSFDYVGEAWTARNCTTSSTTFECKANFTGTFGAKLTPCSDTDPFCWTGL